MREGRLSLEQKAALDALFPGWDAVDEKRSAAAQTKLCFEDKLEVLRRFYAREKRLPKQREMFEGLPVGVWINDFKQDQRKGRLSPERKAALDGALFLGWEALPPGPRKRS